MSRVFKALPLTLAVAALSIFAVSCGSSRPTQVRFVHAIPDAAPLDIDFSSTDVASKQEFTDISFLGVQPNQPGYTSVPSGSDTIKGLLTGQTTQVFSNTASLSGGARYTMVASGFSQNGGTADLLQISDNIPSPPSGNAAFRVVNASPSGPNGIPGAVDVYILLNPTTSPAGIPAFSSLDYTQASNYVSIAVNPNNATTPPGFTVYVTATGSTQPIIIGKSINPPGGAVRTLVLTDIQNVQKMNSIFLELSDLN